MLRRALFPFAFLALLSGCDDPAEPALTMADVAGTYTLTRLDATEQGTTTDWVAGGTEATITLNADGTTTGHMFVPGGDIDEDREMDLAGTWSLSESEVTFEHDADTFLRDMTFEYDDGVLAAHALFGDTSLEVTLTRSP